MKNKFSQDGFSLPEILISIGLMGAVTFGTIKLIVQSEKSKVVSNNSVNRTMLEKTLEGFLYTKNGCDALKNKKIGDAITLNAGNIEFRNSEKIGNIQIKDLKLGTFVQTDDVGKRGMASVSLTLLYLNDNNKTFTKDIPVPINLSDDGTKTIVDCQMNQGRAFTEFVKRICEGSFGIETKGMTCTEAVAYVEKKVIEAICNDVYGSGSAKFNGNQCDLKLIHANESCGSGGKVKGYDSLGKVVCS